MRIKLGAMLTDTGPSLFKRPVTERYPAEHKTTPKRFRGKLHYDFRKCMACQMCARDCPAHAIEIVVLNKATKRFAMNYDVGKCVFCGQCVLSCRYGCLELSSEDWELASSSKEPFKTHYGPDAKEPSPVVA